MRKIAQGKNRKMDSLNEELRQRTIGEFLRGVWLWPRSEAACLARLRDKRVDQVNVDDANEACSVAQVLAEIARLDGAHRAAQRLNVLARHLEVRGAVVWGCSRRELAAVNREMASLYAVQRAAVSAATRAGVSWGAVLSHGFPSTATDFKAVRL